MKASIVYVTTKVVVQHDDDVDPEDVIAECNYDFTIEPDTGKETPKILDTKIIEAENKGECHLTKYFLLPGLGGRAK